jgi:hypothetical protein
MFRKNKIGCNLACGVIILLALFSTTPAFALDQIQIFGYVSLFDSSANTTFSLTAADTDYSVSVMINGVTPGNCPLCTYQMGQYPAYGDQIYLALPPDDSLAGQPAEFSLHDANGAVIDSVSDFNTYDANGVVISSTPCITPSLGGKWILPSDLVFQKYPSSMPVRPMPWVNLLLLGD